MTVINPSINISIGNYGKEYITSFHSYFSENEPEFNEYASFYKCGISSDAIYFNFLKEECIKKDLNLDDKFNRRDLFGRLSEEDNIFFLKNSVSNAYTDLVNLINQLGININFGIVNINIITSSFEDNITIILYRLIEQISELSSSGTTKNISVKVFTVISKNKALLNNAEQIITYQNLEETKVIQSKFSSILHNVIFIDNRNTDAVFLNINNDSIGFVLNEFITYLMTNHYQMIGNLFDADFIALGLGTLIFDEKYFSSFFSKKIINQLVVEEQISSPEIETLSTFKYESLRNITLYSFLKGEKDFESVLSEVKSTLNSTENKITILEYKFLLANLLGKHEAIQLKKPYTNVEKISLYDILFKILNDFNLVLNGTNINILELKKRLDEEENLKIKIKKILEQEKGKVNERKSELEKELESLQTEINNYSESEFAVEELQQQKTEIIEKINFLKNRLRTSDYDNEELLSLKGKLNEIKKLNEEQTQIVKDTLYQFKEKKIGLKIDNFIKPELSKNIDELQVKKGEIVKARKSFFTKLFKPGLKKELGSIENEISAKRNKLKEIEDTYYEVVNSSTPFFEYLDDLEDLHRFIDLAIENINILKTSLNEQYSNSKLLDYLFVKNVIDKNKLEAFYKEKQKDLLNDFSPLISEIIRISLKDVALTEKSNIFSDYLYSRLNNTVNSIIDFNIVEYINGNYDHLNLFKHERLESIIENLLIIAKPFFNSDNAFNPNNSHCLMLHNNDVGNNEIDKLHDFMNSSFTSTIPQQIDTINVNKFSIINIDVIKDLSNMVKYNESKNIYERLNANTIIIS